MMWSTPPATEDSRPPAPLATRGTVPYSRQPLAETSHGPSWPAVAGVVTLGAVAMVGTLPGRTHGLGLITEGLLGDLALGKPEFARLNLVATLVGALFCWPGGWLLDRIGLRITGMFVLMSLGLSTLGIARTTSVAMLWLWVTLTRGLGQSMLSVVSITLVGKSSVGARQAITMAYYSLLVSLFFILAFRGMGWIIPSAGWRAAWQGLGWSLVIAGPVFGALVREPRVAPAAHHSGPAEPGASAKFSQALASPAFWIFALTSSLYALISSGLSLFNQSILAERHFEATVFYDLLSISTFSGLVSNLSAGWLARRVSYGRLMATAMTIYAMALVSFPWVQSLAQVYAYGVAMGACGGVVTVVFFGVWSHAFGRDHLGQIQGTAQAATVLGSAMGPLVFAECLHCFGSYIPAFWITTPCVGLLAILAWIIPTPRAELGRWSK